MKKGFLEVSYHITSPFLTYEEVVGQEKNF